MTSTTKETAQLLADAIHKTMCYMGNERPTCNYDLADGKLMAKVLDKMNLKLVRKDE